MKSLLTLLFITLTFQAAKASEHIILTGGPALRQWEDLRIEKDRHDKWWANFIRASTMHMDKLRAKYGPKAKFTWIVYKEGYVKRGLEDGKPYIKWINMQAAKRGAKLIWISSSATAINAINSRRGAITFDFFGHSNKHCFLFDYSADIMGVSTAWLHENELHKLNSAAFSPRCKCKSWGCHSGESMNRYWKSATGVELIGAKGKTDYTALSFGKMPSINGKWIYKAN